MPGDVDRADPLAGCGRQIEIWQAIARAGGIASEIEILAQDFEVT